jgi:hypothetical protein
MHARQAKITRGLAAALAFVIGAGGAFGYSLMRSRRRQALAASLVRGDPPESFRPRPRVRLPGCHTVAGVWPAKGYLMAFLYAR